MKIRSSYTGYVLTALLGMFALSLTSCAPSRGVQAEPHSRKYRGVLGKGNPKIKREGRETLLWAGGGSPGSPSAQWYQFTGAPIPPEQLQFGIGKDRIRAIDDPVFVSPDDPRLMDLPTSPYRKDETPRTTNDIMVIGYADGSDAHAYPIGLLDHHELVNYSLGAKPVTVGW